MGRYVDSVITLTEDLALQQAKQADEELKKGIYHGLLHGIPYGLKDLFAVKGYKTTWGSTPYKDQVIDEDAFVYQQLRKAGAVLCAKLSMGALANNNKWFGGETKNPWNLQQGSSGSSAGSQHLLLRRDCFLLQLVPKHWDRSYLHPLVAEPRA